MASVAYQPLTICQVSTRSAPLSFRDRIGHLVAAWRDRRRAQQVFARMSERDLHDAGIAAWEIERELARPFWHD